MKYLGTITDPSDFSSKSYADTAFTAGDTITIWKSGTTWPGVPTTRTDVTIQWVGADPSPPIVATRTLGQPGLLDGRDLRFVV